jgi:putative transposase
MQTEQFTTGNYFHIYNRGVNGEDLFKEKRNYYYFLQQYQLYTADTLETFAYTLLKNHFHMLVYVKEPVAILRKDGKGLYKPDASKQLSHFFNSYAQSINKAYNRTGPLFESPFERKLIDDDIYLTSVIYYCHYNPQLHGFVNDFKEWELSSYLSILKNDNTWLVSQKVLDWFGGKELFEKAHKNTYEQKDTGKLFIEKDVVSNPVSGYKP